MASKETSLQLQGILNINSAQSSLKSHTLCVTLYIPSFQPNLVCYGYRYISRGIKVEDKLKNLVGYLHIVDTDLISKILSRALLLFVDQIYVDHGEYRYISIYIYIVCLFVCYR